MCPYSYLNKRNGGGGGKKIRYMLFKIVILLMLKVKKKILFDGIHLLTTKSKGPARYHYATHITF